MDLLKMLCDMADSENCSRLQVTILAWIEPLETSVVNIIYNLLH